MKRLAGSIPRLVQSLALILGTLLLVTSSRVATAQGSPWERVGVYEGRTLYIDPTTARKSGSRVQIFVITDLKEPNATARGRQYFSKKALLELDCNQRTLKVLQDTWYTRRMGEGEPVFQTDGKPQGPYPVQTESPGELFWKGACGRR